MREVVVKINYTLRFVGVCANVVTVLSPALQGLTLTVRDFALFLLEIRDT
jgi:hypothetical protein